MRRGPDVTHGAPVGGVVCLVSGGGDGPRGAGASLSTVVLRFVPCVVLHAACRGALGQGAALSPRSNPQSGGGGRHRWTVSVLGSSTQKMVRVLGFVQPGDGAAAGRGWGEPTGVVVRCGV